MLLNLSTNHMQMSELINYSKVVYQPHKEKMYHYLEEIYGNLYTTVSVDTKEY